MLSHEPVLTYSEFRYYTHPQWSPDGTYLRVSIPPADPRGEPGLPTALWHLPADGSPSEQIGALSSISFFSFPLTFSPDLERLAAVQEIGVPPENDYSLHVAKADGSEDVIYLEGGYIVFDSWSPDSQHFIFSITENVPAYQLATVGGGFQPLIADPTVIINISWVDQDHYLYNQARDGTFEIRLGNTDGTSTLIDTVDGFSAAYDFTGQPT
jgi:hypothetical protein